MTGRAFAALQAALHLHLSSDPELLALGVGLYDNIPQPSACPYLVYGPASATDRSSRTVSREKVTQPITIYCQGGGRSQALAILAAVAASLDGWTVAGNDPAIGLVTLDRASVAGESDGVTWQAEAALSAFVEFPM